MRKVSKLLALVATVPLLLAGCSSEPEARDSEVGVQLFMWNWNSVAKECKEVIGPSGIDWVLVSPPQEHILGGAWWVHYQPVSYRLESALGSREEFAQMVKDCNSAGVRVIADAVINHMTAQESGVGSAGTEFSKYDYPGLYNYDSFHHCDLTDNGQIQSYSDKDQVQTCELLGLSDLDQSRPEVREQILSYLNDLISLGVGGIRIDAAKHIAAEDLKAITDELPEDFRVLQEVIRGGGEPITPEDYLESGEVWEFEYARAMRSMFLDEIIYFANNQERFAGYSPSEKTISFISNHDTERNGQTLNFTQPKDFELATLMMLAEDYGQPMLLSSYSYLNYDDAPTSVDGVISDVECPAEAGPLESYEAGQWICQHRWPKTVAMIKFREVSSGAMTNELLNQNGLLAFERGDKGFFALNVTSVDGEISDLPTSLADGSYCQILAGSDCKEVVQVLDGKISASLPAKSAIAIHLEAKK